MEERFQFIQEYGSKNWSFAELCRRRGVSRKTGYKWLARYREEGADGLRDQSRAPREHPNQILAEVAEAVVELRREYPLWGPEKLRARLQRTMPEILWPAASTIGELLQRKGLTVPAKRHRKAGPSLHPLSHVREANQVWCVDFKGWFHCGDGSRCDPLTLTDAHSRYLLRCRALQGQQGRRVRDVMETAFREYGLPEGLRSDNGEPFASAGVGGLLSQLSAWWLKLGIRPERIPRGKPQHNGRHERMHRTLKAATTRPAAGNLRMQQQAFDAFQREYNWERPHEALQMKTPGGVLCGLLPPVPQPAGGARIRR